MIEPKDQEQAWEATEIADGPLMAHGSSAAQHPRRLPAGQTGSMTRARARARNPRCARRTPEMWSSIHAEDGRQPLMDTRLG